MMTLLQPASSGCLGQITGVGALLLDVLASIALQQGMDAAEYEALSASLLLVGPPAVGKTTLLRDVVSLLNDRFRKNVVIVDTSNEIAGDGVLPHPCVGSSRRMPVPSHRSMKDTLKEAVQNHSPQVLVVDEIGTRNEAMTVKSMAQRGVVMAGTAHGRSLSDLLKNPDLDVLVGGSTSVTLGDAAAGLEPGGGGKIPRLARKTRLERKTAPAFSTLVEVLGHGRLQVHPSVSRSMDAMLAGDVPQTQLRRFDAAGNMVVQFEGGCTSGGA